MHCSCSAPLELSAQYVSEDCQTDQRKQLAGRDLATTDVASQKRSVAMHSASAAALADKQWVVNASEETRGYASVLNFRCRCRARITLQIKIAEV